MDGGEGEHLVSLWLVALRGLYVHHAVWKTFVNGQLAYSEGRVNDEVRGKEVRYILK